MGIPINAEIDGRYVLTQDKAGNNSKVIITRLSDDTSKQMVVNAEFLALLDGLMTGAIDHAVLGALCDTLFE
jgi:hypothetical protein